MIFGMFYNTFLFSGQTGDLFEKLEDINDEQLWLDAGSEDHHAQRSNRLRMALFSDLIVPGHGTPFKVTEAIREKLKADADSKNK